MKQTLVEFDKITKGAKINGDIYLGKHNNQSVALKVYRCAENLRSVDFLIEELDRLKYVPSHSN
jgi:hypothetical protein